MMSPTRRTARQTRRAGFTLMEVLLVLAIMGVIMSLVVPKIMGRQRHAHDDATRLSIKGVEQALKMYAMDHAGRYPSTADGLRVLVEAPARRDPRWRGPYLESIPLDAWGSTMTYTLPGRHNPQGFDIVSPGADLQPDTDDDLGNWDAGEPLSS